MPRVSLGLPVYNGERYLRFALDSILAQTFTDFELIICDNASTDTTVEICNAYSAKDPRIAVHRNPENLGAAKNYNKVFELSRGEYFKWASHDDTIAPTYLERCVGALDTNLSFSLCYPTTVVIDANGRALDTDPNDNITANGNTPNERLKDFLVSNARNRKCNAVFGLIRTSFLKRTPLIGAFASSDKVLLAELALYGEFAHLPDPLFFRRDHPESSVNANPGLKERTAWFDPKKKNSPSRQHWTWLSEYLNAVRRVPMNPAQKILCRMQLLRWVRWERKRLMQELTSSVTRPFATGTP
ncbi:MAG: glycosyltransferase family 2 protein [Bacteroidota bacterium]